MSLFQSIYNFKESDRSHKKENYLTEIFAYCLKVDDVFRKHFLKKIGFHNVNIKFKIATQINTKNGRPDLCLESESESKTKIFIENKINSKQEATQLERYCDELLKNKTIENRFLIYITKNYEQINLKSNVLVNFKHLRWFEIYDTIVRNKIPNNITNEFAEYLDKEKMSKKLDFTKKHNSFFNYYFEVTSIMDEFLKFVTEEKKIIDDYGLKRFSDSHFEKKDLSKGKKINLKSGVLWLGFYYWEDEMKFAVEFRFQNLKSSTNAISELLKLKKTKWFKYEEINVYRTIPFNELFDSNNFSKDKVMNFIFDSLNSLNKNKLLKEIDK